MPRFDGHQIMRQRLHAIAKQVTRSMEIQKARIETRMEDEAQSNLLKMLHLLQWLLTLVTWKCSADPNSKHGAEQIDKIADSSR